MKCVVPEGGEFVIGTAITETHRADMLAKAGEIDAWLQDRRPERNIGVVSMVLTALPHRDMSEGTATIKLAAFKIALEDVPTWAIETAINRWIKGDIGDGGYAPTPPQLRQAAQGIAITAWGRAQQMRKLAAMPVQRVVSKEERERALAVLASAKLKKFPAEEDEGAS